MKDSVWSRPIRELLSVNGYKDKEVAARAGVSEKVVAQVRKGRRISLDSADRLCMALGTSLAEQYGEGDGNPTDDEVQAQARASARDRKARERKRAA